MNAAARLFNQGVLSRGWVVSLFLTRFQLTLFLLIMSILFSALGLVYVTNTTRSINATLQQLTTERDRLHVQYGQLLLEKSTLLMQARIQTVAENRLGMVMPEGKSLVIIDSQ